jgi:hypothetical protein
MIAEQALRRIRTGTYLKRTSHPSRPKLGEGKTHLVLCCRHSAGPSGPPSQGHAGHWPPQRKEPLPTPGGAPPQSAGAGETGAPKNASQSSQDCAGSRSNLCSIAETDADLSASHRPKGNVDREILFERKEASGFCECSFSCLVPIRVLFQF